LICAVACAHAAVQPTTEINTRFRRHPNFPFIIPPKLSLAEDENAILGITIYEGVRAQPRKLPSILRTFTFSFLQLAASLLYACKKDLLKTSALEALRDCHSLEARL